MEDRGKTWVSDRVDHVVSDGGWIPEFVTHWIMNALISGTFSLIATSAGGYPFVFFSTMMLLQFFVVLFIYPETKGVTLEEIQKQLAISQTT